MSDRQFESGKFLAICQAIQNGDVQAPEIVDAWLQHVDTPRQEGETAHDKAVRETALAVVLAETFGSPDKVFSDPAIGD